MWLPQRFTSWNDGRLMACTTAAHPDDDVIQCCHVLCQCGVVVQAQYVADVMTQGIINPTVVRVSYL